MKQLWYVSVLLPKFGPGYFFSLGKETDDVPVVFLTLSITVMGSIPSF